MQVKVWNEDHREWVEEFKGNEIRIPPKGHILMTRSEAVQLLKQYSPPIKNGRGDDLRPKILRMEVDPEEFAARTDQPLKYMAMDGNQFRTTEGLKKYEESIKAEVSDGRKRAVKVGETA